MMLCSSVAMADPIVLRMATPAPEGTLFAREGRAFAREIEAATAGRVRVKVFMGGIAGDDVAIEQRIRRGQIDGVASGGMLCSHLAPSMKVMQLPGLVQSAEESLTVSNRMRPVFDAETSRAGFQMLGDFGLGPVMVWSRRPIRTAAELRHTKLWGWDL